MVRPRKGKKGSAAKAWKYQKGEPPNTVTANERLSRGRTVEVRWWLSETKKFRTRSLGFGIRDERGVIDPDLEQEAVRQTQALPQIRPRTARR